MSRPAAAQSGSDAEAVAEAGRSGLPFLVFRDRDERQRLLILPPGSTSLTVGREPSADLAFAWDPQVSRLHARFERARESWLIVDDGQSSNGTFVNGERVSGRRPLSDGDVLRFGGTSVQFRAAQPSHDPAPAQPPREQAGVVAEAPAVQLSSTQRRVLAALCRPCLQQPTASPATDLQIGEELVLSVGEVRAHVQVLCAKLGIAQRPSTEWRARLATHAISTGLIS